MHGHQLDAVRDGRTLPDEAELVRALERWQVGEREEDATGTGREQELGRERDAAVDRVEVSPGEVEEHVGAAVGAEHDAALVPVLDQRGGGEHVIVLAHPARVLLADPRERGGEQAGRHRGVADQHAFLQEMMDVEGLVGADPGVEPLLEEADDLRVRVGVEAAADHPRA